MCDVAVLSRLLSSQTHSGCQHNDTCQASCLPDAMNEELPAGLGCEPEDAEHDLLLLQPVEVHRLEQLQR